MPPRAFAAAFQLEPHPTKTVQFGAPRKVRTALQAAAPGVAVERSFRDLGVRQVLGAAGAAGAAKHRTDGAWGRFERLASLPMPYPQRVRATACAGVAAATWGAVVGPPATHLLAKLRTAAGRAVWRGGRFGAVELRLLLGAPTAAADPAAAFAFGPLLMLAKALRWGLTHEAEVRAVQARAGATPVHRGVVAALKALRLRDDWLCWTPVELPEGEGAGRLWPADAPLARVRGWLQERWRLVSARAVAKRRPGYAPAAAGIDWALAKRQLADPWLSAGLRAALLTVMVGDTVQHTRASHWREGNRRCPHCPAE